MEQARGRRLYLVARAGLLEFSCCAHKSRDKDVEGMCTSADTLEWCYAQEDLTCVTPVAQTVTGQWYSLNWSSYFSSSLMPANGVSSIPRIGGLLVFQLVLAMAFE